MTSVKVGLLYATDRSVSLAIALDVEETSYIKNEELLSFCKEGLLRTILDKKYEDLASFRKELAFYKTQSITTLIDENLPTVKWALLNNKPALELQSQGAEGAIFSIKVLRGLLD